MESQLGAEQKAQLLSSALNRPKVEDASALLKKPRIGEELIRFSLLFCGAVSILTTIGILYVLLADSLLFFTQRENGELLVTVGEFFGSTTWQPRNGDYGIWALVSATFVTSLIAMLVAIPVGLSAAIYLSEYATPRVRGTLKPILEILATVPTVVFGFFALTFFAPLIRGVVGQGIMPLEQAMLPAGIVMGFMIVPLISSVSEDALSAVPRHLREASYGLGATKIETALKVVVPAAISGIVAAFILGISRAVGETMIVAIASGAVSKFTFNPFEAAETMTGHIVRISSGELPLGGIEYNSLFAIGLTLFLITLVLNLAARRIIARFREVY